MLVLCHIVLRVRCPVLYMRKYVHKYKENFVILRSIGIIVIKSSDQGQSSTPADILVDNLIPTPVH